MAETNGTSLAVRITTVREWIAEQQGELEKVLTPQGLDATRYGRIVVTACLRNPKLLECSRASLMLSVMECAALGLEIDSVSGLAYLVPFKGVATLIVGYRGMVQLAYRHPKVVAMGAEAIFEGDHYVYEQGIRPKLTHRPIPGNPKTWDTLIACYATSQIAGGGRPFHFMWKEDIEEHRARSASWKRDAGSSPWTTDAIAMAKKTPVRQLAKFIPQSAQLMRALAVEDDPERESAPGSPPLSPGATVDDVLDAVAEAGERA